VMTCFDEDCANAMAIAMVTNASVTSTRMDRSSN
jgi:hypothetical protein